MTTALRTFLFADLRDYTAFVEGAGDHAAADLIRSYRGIPDRIKVEVVAPRT